MSSVEELHPGDIVTVHVQGLGSHGEGLARNSQNEIFIPKTARDDKVQADRDIGIRYDDADLD